MNIYSYRGMIYARVVILKTSECLPLVPIITYNKFGSLFQVLLCTKPVIWSWQTLHIIYLKFILCHIIFNASASSDCWYRNITGASIYPIIPQHIEAGTKRYSPNVKPQWGKQLPLFSYVTYMYLVFVTHKEKYIMIKMIYDHSWCILHILLCAVLLVND